MKKRNILYSWRFYTLDRHEYHECMEKLFPLNLTGIRHLNAMCSAMSLVFMIFPVLIEKNLYKAGFYLSVSFLTAGIAVLAGIKEREHKNDGKRLSRPFVYALMILGHANLIAFGIYIGVWTMPDTLAVNFMVFLVCSLFLFINPAAFNLILTLCSVAVFIIFTVTMKTSSLWTFDAVNALVAGVVNAAFTWLVVKFRILAAYNAGKLEEERNSYYDQSTVDELTQLKNRRDFMQTFQRYLTSYRDSDVYLCIAVADLDFFKNYNDYYGHPEGDECLRMVGKAFNGLRGAADIYAARIGGEEFALLWFEKNTDKINGAVSKIQKSISDLNIPHARSSVSKFVTISLGVYIVRCGSSGNMREIHKAADDALYEAKEKGRSRAVVTGEHIERYTLMPPE